jgi:hypothetical protein
MEPEVKVPVDEPAPTPPPELVKMDKKPMPKMPMVGLLVILLVLALGAVGFLVYQNMQLSKKVAEMQAVAPLASIVPTSSPVADETANWKIYQNHNLEFRYPVDWSISYDAQPDPTGNPTKYSVTVGSLDITILSSDQYKTFETLQSISNLPSGTSTITSKKEIQVGEQKALYVVQSNNLEGVIVLDLKNNLVFMEVDSKDKAVFNQILSTVKFTN